MDNVIIRIMLLLLLSPGRMGQFIWKKSAYCNQKMLKICLLLSVLWLSLIKMTLL
jgi:hypothetical protein